MMDADTRLRLAAVEHLKRIGIADDKPHRKRTGSRRTEFDLGRKSVRSVRSKFDIANLGAIEFARF